MSNHWLDDNAGSVSLKAADHRIGLGWLLAAAIATVLLWQIPAGGYILYPFTILATWFHEMAHGLTALFLEGQFQQLLIFPNGSGLAVHSGVRFLGPVGNALVAFGGPMGPPIAGSLFILASQRWRSARIALLFLGSLLVLSAVVWVRSLFGLVVIPLMGLVVLAIAFYAPRWVQGVAILFLGIQACISTFHQLGYLFTQQVVIAGQPVLSDSGAIAQALLLPYWFWGGLMTVLSALLLWNSLTLVYGRRVN